MNEVNDTENERKQKRMHRQFVRGKEGIDWDRTWQWIAKGDLKGCTEALICSAQEQALRTNYTKFHIDHTAESPLCRMCGSKGETMAHVVRECSKLHRQNCPLLKLAERLGLSTQSYPRKQRFNTLNKRISILALLSGIVLGGQTQSLRKFQEWAI